MDSTVRFSTYAQQALRLARQEAEREGDRLTPERLLLGLLRVPEGDAGQVLASLGVDAKSAQRRLRMRRRKDGTAARAASLIRLRKVIDHASRNAPVAHPVGTGDLLRGLLREEEETTLGGVLSDLGAPRDRVEAELDRMPPEEGLGPAPLAPDLQMPLEAAAQLAAGEGSPQVHLSHLLRALDERQQLTAAALLLQSLTSSPTAAARPPASVVGAIARIEVARQQKQAAIDRRDPEAAAHWDREEAEQSRYLDLELRVWQQRLRE